MRNTIRISILYFPLVLIYKLFADVETLITCDYWINSYWLVTAIYFMFIFIDVRRMCFDKTYKLIALLIAFYWGIMAILRIYVLFNIEQHYNIMISADRIGVGSVAIVGILIFLSAKIWHQK